MVYTRILKSYFSKLLQHRLDLTTENLWILLENHYTLIGRNMSRKFKISLRSCDIVSLVYNNLLIQCSERWINELFQHSRSKFGSWKWTPHPALLTVREPTWYRSSADTGCFSLGTMITQLDLTTAGARRETNPNSGYSSGHRIPITPTGSCILTVAPYRVVSCIE